jgi:hypothetical protein
MAATKPYPLHTTSSITPPTQCKDAGEASHVCRISRRPSRPSVPPRVAASLAQNMLKPSLLAHTFNLASQDSSDTAPPCQLTQCKDVGKACHVIGTLQSPPVDLWCHPQWVRGLRDASRHLATLQLCCEAKVRNLQSVSHTKWTMCWPTKSACVSCTMLADTWPPSSHAKVYLLAVCQKALDLISS